MRPRLSAQGVNCGRRGFGAKDLSLERWLEAEVSPAFEMIARCKVGAVLQREPVLSGGSRRACRIGSAIRGTRYV